MKPETEIAQLFYAAFKSSPIQTYLFADGSVMVRLPTADNLLGITHLENRYYDFYYGAYYRGKTVNKTSKKTANGFAKEIIRFSYNTARISSQLAWYHPDLGERFGLTPSVPDAITLNKKIMQLLEEKAFKAFNERMTRYPAPKFETGPIRYNRVLMDYEYHPKGESVTADEHRDFFICHASEDKEAVVQPMIEALKAHGFSCWYAEEQIGWGDSITELINEGMKRSRYVICIISKNLVQKPWPRREINAAINLEIEGNKCRILPLLVGTDVELSELLSEFPLISDKLYLRWSGTVDSIIQAARRL